MLRHYGKVLENYTPKAKEVEAFYFHKDVNLIKVSDQNFGSSVHLASNEQKNQWSLHDKVRWYVTSHFHIYSLEKTRLQETLARENVAKMKELTARNSGFRKRS